MAEQLDETRAVSVTNISPTANEKTVSDFFSFCGKISKLYMNKDKPDSNGALTAVVQFETESAAKTALLLTNALIVDRPITVVPYTGTQASATLDSTVSPTPTPLGAPVDESNITQRDFHGVADEHRTKTSVVASLMAAGYVFGADALDRAKEYDEKHNISLQAKVAVEQLKVKAHEIDQTYHISEKAQQVKTAVVEKGKQIDESYHLTEKAQQVKTSVTSTAQNVAAKAAENPAVKSAIDTTQSYASRVAASATALYQDYKQQTQKAIEEKKKQQGQTHSAPDNEKPTAAQGETSSPQPVQMETSPQPDTTQPAQQ